jgi:hypothetical protein
MFIREIDLKDFGFGIWDLLELTNLPSLLTAFSTNHRGARVISGAFVDGMRCAPRSSMNERAQELRNRTRRFAASLGRFLRTVPRDPVTEEADESEHWPLVLVESDIGRGAEVENPKSLNQILKSPLCLSAPAAACR